MEVRIVLTMIPRISAHAMDVIVSLPKLSVVGQPQFGKHVVPALQNLLDAADKAGLDAVGALAEELIAKSEKCHHHGGDCHCHEH